MGQYVELPGVKTWYEVHGEGDPLVLLHGGLCTNETWGPQLPALTDTFRAFLPERRAHGHTPDVEGALSYDDMTKDTVDFLESVVGGPASLVGWSDGGIVALMVAIARPELVKKLVVVGANFLPASESGSAPEMLEHMSADSPDMAMFRDLYVASSPDGPEHWPAVVEKLGAMWRSEPKLSSEDLGRIAAPTLVMVGDDDLMTLEHTIALFRSVPKSELAVVPGTSHALLMEKPEVANGLIVNFLTTDPAPTMLPIRRAAATAGT